jgi:hypothetical protein
VLCEHPFVTSYGSPYARFRRALDTGNLLLIRAAAKELPQVSLPDALRMIYVMAEASDRLYERAAMRWLGRFCLEHPGATLEDLRRANAALTAVGIGFKATEATAELADLCAKHGMAT